MPTTTPCARASSPPSSASCWNAVGSPLRPKRRWLVLALSKAGTTPSGCIPHWAIARPWPTKLPWRQSQPNRNHPSPQTLHEIGATSEGSQCDGGSRTRSYVLGARESRVQGEGARQSETGSGKHRSYPRRRMKVSTQLAQIAKKAELDRKVRFTSLAHLLTPAFLQETWGMINRHGAGGVDGESIQQLESTLEQRLQDICERLKAGAYRAPPVRRSQLTPRPRQ